MSKGSKQRPSAVDDDVVAQNWENIFNRPKEGDYAEIDEDDYEVIPEALIKIFENRKALLAQG